ncbi:conserved hypothetical protein [Paraburkholderia piptadeniae]|uniref:Uncharacterized protein n=1 Tax=Paraburkholderia piptadeniae TaxID=1701573 RepID=A0A1N7SBG2_9BURK|nr:conserved hypothetical protein [Paraburkholderia piptadeniae]
MWVAVSYRATPALVAASRSACVLCGANAYTQFAAKGCEDLRCRGPQRGCMKQVRRLSSALVTHVEQDAVA